MQFSRYLASFTCVKNKDGSEVKFSLERKSDLHTFPTFTYFLVPSFSHLQGPRTFLLLALLSVPRSALHQEVQPCPRTIPCQKVQPMPENSHMYQKSQCFLSLTPAKISIHRSQMGIHCLFVVVIVFKILFIRALRGRVRGRRNMT